MTDADLTHLSGGQMLNDFAYDSDYKELSGEFPEYQDTKHPRLAAAATSALRAALERSAENACEVQELWDVFQNFVRRHEHGAFVDALVGELHEAVRDAIATEKMGELREDARSKVYLMVQADHGDAIRRQVADELRVEVRQQIVDEIRPGVEAKLREEMMINPDFIASVKADLQRKMLGL